jgi:hypothetical protein
MTVEQIVLVLLCFTTISVTQSTTVPTLSIVDTFKYISYRRINDMNTGKSTAPTLIPVEPVLMKDVCALNPIQNMLYFQSIDETKSIVTLVGISTVDGLVKTKTQVDLLYSLEFDTTTQQLYGIINSGKDAYCFASIDATTGNYTNIAAFPTGMTPMTFIGGRYAAYSQQLKLFVTISYHDDFDYFEWNSVNVTNGQLVRSKLSVTAHTIPTSMAFSANDGLLYAAISDFVNLTRVVQLDIKTGSVVKEIATFPYGNLFGSFIDKSNMFYISVIDERQNTIYPYVISVDLKAVKSVSTSKLYDYIPVCMRLP